MRRRASEGGRTVWRSGGRLAAAALLLTARPPDHLSAQEINNSGALFLVFPVGARAVGMGQAAAALEGRGEAAFWNPAGLATLEQSGPWGGGVLEPGGTGHAGAERVRAPERDARGGRDP